MKFPQLPLGARFRWQGEHYRKTGPMTAHAEAGGEQRLIPRSAAVEPVDNGTPPPTGEARLSASEVRAALDAFSADLRGYAASLDGSDRSALEARIAAAARSFRDALRL
jgi:hypothetical protein